MSAMQQSDSWRNNLALLYSPELREILKNAYVVEDADRQAALTDQTNKNPTKLREKKTLLKNLLAERTNILNHAEQFDDVFNTNMKDVIARLIPSAQKDVPKDNDSAARALVSLLGPLQVFMSKYTEQRELSNETMRSTRGATQEPLHIQYVQQILDIFKQVDVRVVEENAGKLINKFKPATLTKQQRERTFSKARHLILDEQFRDCLFCLHPSMNSVPENDDVVSHNTTTLAEHNAANTVWQDYKRRLDAERKKAGGGRTLALPKNPNTNKEMKQAPKLGTLLEIILMCMCKTAQCLMKGSDIGSSCFTLCMDVGTNIRCTWDPTTGKCTCEVCMCQCPAAYLQKHAAQIALGLMQLQQDGHLDTLVNSAPKDGGAAQLREFMVKAANGGVLAAADATANNNNVSEEDVGSIMMEHTASAIVRSAGLLSASARQAVKKQFGHSTEVTLPNGSRINTRQLGVPGMNIHTNNNRLGASASTAGQYLPGMQNHQQPDLNNPTQDFVTAAQQPSIANAFLGPLFTAASTAASSSAAAAAPSAANMAGMQDISHQQVMSDAAYARQLDREQQLQKYASMPNGGGKMPAGTQQDITYLDGLTPSPLPTTNRPPVVSTLSSGAVPGRGQTGTGRDPSAAESLFSPFGASSSTSNSSGSGASSSNGNSRSSSLSNTTRSAEEREEARNNNAYATLQNVENYNTLRFTNWKSKQERTAEEKKARVDAKRLRETVIVPLRNMREENPADFTNIMSSVVAPGEQTLSQTPLKTSPQKLLGRLQNALAGDSSSDEDEEGGS